MQCTELYYITTKFIMTPVVGHDDWGRGRVGGVGRLQVGRLLQRLQRLEHLRSCKKKGQHKRSVLREWLSPEVAFELPTKPSQVRFSYVGKVQKKVQP